MSDRADACPPGASYALWVTHRQGEYKSVADWLRDRATTPKMNEGLPSDT